MYKPSISSNSGYQLVKRIAPDNSIIIENSLDNENSEKIRLLESKQRSMEQTLSMIINQNTKLMEENKILLHEIFKSKFSLNFNSESEMKGKSNNY